MRKHTYIGQKILNQERIQHIVTLFQRIKDGERAAYERLFGLYFDKLVVIARSYVGQSADAEELVMDLFVKLWMRRDILTGVVNPDVYLFVSVKNSSLNFIRSNKKRGILFTDPDQAEELNRPLYHPDTGSEKELSQIIASAVEALPAQRRVIFQLIKEDGLTSKQVAEILSLSTRTVENQLYKAVKTLADAISGYLGYHPQKQNRKRTLKLPLLFF